MGLIVHESLIDFFLGIEDERAVLDDFLVKRETGDED
jgi:hypothetical protein